MWTVSELTSCQSHSAELLLHTHTHLLKERPVLHFEVAFLTVLRVPEASIKYVNGCFCYWLPWPLLNGGMRGHDLTGPVAMSVCLSDEEESSARSPQINMAARLHHQSAPSYVRGRCPLGSYLDQIDISVS